jgi:SAM-dependent methyltransferase
MAVTTHDRPYLPGMTRSGYLAHVAQEHPLLLPLLDFSETALAAATPWLTGPQEFDLSARGDSYLKAHQERRARSVGGLKILARAGCFPDGRTPVVIDALGGDAVLAQLWHDHRRCSGDALIVTGDVSGDMVARALQTGLPAVRQPAQRMLLRDGVAHAVILAYGTHHIPEPERDLAFAEASRVLARGGRIVVHDFAQDSPTARWFGEVVDRWCPVGHPHRHFTATGLAESLIRNGFDRVSTSRMYDPFRLTAALPGLAVRRLLTHVAQMYGLTAALQTHGAQWLTQQIATCFPPGISVRRAIPGYLAELPRHALVAVGYKA